MRTLSHVPRHAGVPRRRGLQGLLSIKPEGVESYFTDNTAGVTLQEIFQDKAGNELIWACCRNLRLKKTRPKGVMGHTGVNLEQRPDGFYDYNFSTKTCEKIW